MKRLRERKLLKFEKSYKNSKSEEKYVKIIKVDGGPDKNSWYGKTVPYVINYFPFIRFECTLSGWQYTWKKSFLHARRRMFRSAWSCVVFFWIMIIPDLIWMIRETSLFWVGTERFYARSSSSGWNMEWWYGYWRVSSDGGVFLTWGNGKYWGYWGVETYYITSLKCLFQIVLKNL